MKTRFKKKFSKNVCVKSIGYILKGFKNLKFHNYFKCTTILHGIEISGLKVKVALTLRNDGEPRPKSGHIRPSLQLPVWNHAFFFI